MGFSLERLFADGDLMEYKKKARRLPLGNGGNGGAGGSLSGGSGVVGGNGGAGGSLSGGSGRSLVRGNAGVNGRLFSWR